MAPFSSSSGCSGAAVRARLGALLCALLWLGPGVSMHANPGTVPRLPWIFDGAVLASARLGNTLYVGGSFTAVAPSATAMPPVYALSEATGGVLGPAFPAMDGEVAAIEPDGSGGYFLGGDFTVVGGLSQPYLVHVLANGSLDPEFRPTLMGAVTSLGLAGTTLYAVGGFGGLPPARVGAVSAIDGALLPWQPQTSWMQSIGGLIVANDRVVVWGTHHLPMLTTGVVIAYEIDTAAQLWVTAVSGVQGNGSVSTVLQAADQLIVASSDGLKRLTLSTGTLDTGWDPQVTPAALALEGATLYLGGAFSTVAGQPRQNLAAIDVETAALLPWNPNAPVPIADVTTTSSGDVYVSGGFATFAGQPRLRLARIDASGAVTPWVAAVPPGNASAIREGAGGTLLVSSSLTASGWVARRGLAAFDLDSDMLLPWSPSLGTVRFLAAAGDRVWAGISGATFVFDATTGLDVDFIGYSTPFFSDDRWIYRASWNLLTQSVAIERADLMTGAADPSWEPSVFVPDTVAAQGDVLFFASSVHGLAAVDRRTAHVLWTNPAAAARLVTISGDTLFTFYSSFAGGVQSFDARSGRPIQSRIWNASTVESFTVVDGRLVVLAWPLPALVALDGQQLPWDVGLRRVPGGFFGGHVSVAGELLVLGGWLGRRLPDARQGLVVVPLDDERALADLAARPSGPTTTFSWTPPAPAAPDGYVIEAGTSPGTTLAAIPVGGATSFAAEVPQGDFFVRVRATGMPGGIEQVSNEIRVRGGCESAPASPTGLAAILHASGVTVSWSPPDAVVTRYIVEAGSAPGLADLASMAWPGGQTILTANAPPGTYHVRVRAVNGCGSSPPSAGIYFKVGASVPLPAAPSGLRYQLEAGLLETIRWTPPPGEVTGYILEAGSDIGLANLLAIDVGRYPRFAIPAFTTPRGTYLVRVRAVNTAGVGPPSADFVLRLQ